MENVLVSAKKPDVITGHPIWGQGLTFRENPVKTLLDLKQKHGDVYCMKVFLGMYYYIVMRPESFEHVLRANQRNYIKPDLFMNTMGRLTGKGLITNEGEPWQKQRRIMAPAFHRQKLALLTGDMTNEISYVINKWKNQIAQNPEMDIQQEMITLTMQIASKSLFSSDIISKADDIGNSVKVALEFIGEGLKNPLLIHNFLPTSKRREFDDAKKTLEKVIGEIIRNRRENPVDKHDLLGMLLDARDEETQETMTERQLIDEVLTLIIGGHETTSLALTWTWYLLSLYPEKMKKLREEADSVLNGRMPTMEDYPKLVYTLQVFNESMRMYPPAWASVRLALEDDVIDGYEVPKGSMIFLPFWASYYDSDVWENPMVFMPERFSAEEQAKRHKYAFVPFGGGMRQCIGNHFAMMEAVLVIASLAQSFSFELISNQEVEIDTGFTLKSKNGIKMRVSLRETGK
ncbi:MAG: cytochrome P450 [Bacteroidia bacterium]|nr:cytochrome P450 [Bacteroidia bacterium]